MCSSAIKVAVWKLTNTISTFIIETYYLPKLGISSIYKIVCRGKEELLRRKQIGT
jgi:hypothetical protein